MRAIISLSIYKITKYYKDLARVYLENSRYLIKKYWKPTMLHLNRQENITYSVYSLLECSVGVDCGGQVGPADLHITRTITGARLHFTASFLMQVYLCGMCLLGNHFRKPVVVKVTEGL